MTETKGAPKALEKKPAEKPAAAPAEDKGATLEKENLELRGKLASALADADRLRAQLKAKDAELFAADDARARLADALVNARLVQGVGPYQPRTAWAALVQQVRAGLAKVPRA